MAMKGFYQLVFLFSIVFLFMSISGCDDLNGSDHGYITTERVFNQQKILSI